MRWALYALCAAALLAAVAPAAAQAPPTAARISITGGAGITVNPSPLVGTGTVTCTTFSSSLVGCVAASGGGTANFLRADGTWAPPPSTSGGTVTSITQGTNLTFSANPITTTGTINCNVFTNATGGCVASSGGGTVNFLRADGTWAPPGATGGVTWPASNSLVVSNSSSSPLGLAPVNGDLAFGVGGLWAASTPSTMLDTAFGSTRGGVLYRGASAWTLLAAGTSGNFLQTQGTTADPVWAAAPTGGAPPLREITTAAITDPGQTTDCNGTIVWKSATAGAKIQTLPTCSNGASVTVIDGKGDAAAGGQILLTAGTGATLGGVPAGTNTLLIGANAGSVKLTYDTQGTTPNWVVSASNNPGGVVPITANTPVSVGQWFSGSVFSTSTSGLTLTLPLSSTATATTPVVANGGITVQTLGASLILAVQTGDAMVGAGVSGLNLNIPSYTTSVVTLQSTGTYAVTMAPSALETTQWSAGMNLGGCSALPCFIPMFRVGQPRNIIGLLCGFDSVATSGTTSIDIVTSTGATLAASPVKVNPTACTGDTAGYTAQSPIVGTATLGPTTLVGLRVNSWGATSCPNCSGMVQVALQ
jgi:hypothetical protein